MDWKLVVLLAAPVVLVVIWRVLAGHLSEKARVSAILADVQAGRLPNAPLEELRYGAVSLTEDGFSLRRGGRPAVDVKWDNVSEITAYKADLFSYDVICLVFARSDQGDRIEVDEQMHGYTKFECAVEAHYGDALLDGWWRTVAFPAFVPNVTVIWQEQDPAKPPAENE